MKGGCFSDGGASFLNWGRVPHGGASVLMGGGFEKNRWMGEGAPSCPPLLRETMKPSIKKSLLEEME